MILIIHLLFLSSNIQLTSCDIIDKFYLMCGRDYICNTTHLKNFIVPTLSYSNVGLCPNCSCDTACISTGDCCPDVYFNFPKQECMDTVFLDSSEYNISSTYPMINKCPDTATGIEKELCTEQRTILQRINNLPVTSVSNLSFANRYCAYCYGVDNFTDWELSISCFKLSDFNYFSTFEEVIKHAKNNSCVMKHEPPTDLYEKVPNCSLAEEVTYYRCNMTGRWVDFDIDIMTGCDSTYALRYHMFKNIFCYMCNPLKQVHHSVIDVCNTTGVWHPFDSDLERACIQNDMILRRYPYKNVFCFICNRNNTDDQSMQDVNGDIFLTPLAFKYPFYDYKISNLKYSLPFYVNIFKSSQNSNQPELDKSTYIKNMTQLLMNYYANTVNAGKLCDPSLLPSDLYSIINKTGKDCSCTPNEGLTNLCPDFAITHTTQYVTNVIHDGIYVNDSAKEMYHTSSSCPQPSNGVLESRCQSSTVQDIFSLLPVKISEATFKNLDCLLCNSDFRFNGNFEKLAEYTPFQNNISIPFRLRILCPGQYLDYYRLLTLFNMIEEAKANDCRVSLITGQIYGQPSYDWLEKEYSETIVRKCNVTGKWSTYDNDIKEACEQINSFSFHIVGIDIYRNVFCAMCNLQSTPENQVRFCDNSSYKYNHELQSGCDLFPISSIYPPFRNVFCECCNTFCGDLNVDFVPLNPCTLEPYWCSCVGAGCVLPTDIQKDKFKNLFTVQQNEDLKGHAECSANQFYDQLRQTCRKVYPPPDNCNSEPYTCSCAGVGCLVPNNIPGVKFRNLFTVKHEKKIKTQIKCPANQFDDQLKRSCRQKYCYPGKVLSEDKCVPLFLNTGNIRYTINIVAEKYNNKTIDVETMLQMMAGNIPFWWHHILSTNLYRSLDITVLHFHIKSLSNCSHLLPVGKSTLFNITVNFIVTSVVNRLDLESTLLYLQENVLMYEMDKGARSRTTQQQCRNASTADTDLSCDHFTSLEHCFPQLTRYRSTLMSDPVLCRAVQYSADEYDMKGESVYLKLEQIVLRRGQFYFTNNKNKAIRVCIDYIKQHDENTVLTKSTLEMVVDVLNIICTCVSAICLLVTFIVYSCIKSLRTLPGKVNMCLILSLFIAQICLQFGMIWTHRPVVCQVVGIVIHVFWLSTFACMNVASFHMYSVFSKTEVYDASLDSNKFMKYTLYAFGVPICIVTTNVIVHYVINDVGNLGYGVGICFISGMVSKIVSFIVPVALICIVNIVMFLCTACMIRQRPNVRSTRNARRDFVVYIKLFSLTGITWLGQMIDALFPLSIFTVVVTVLAGLQGLFIFLSYVCNKGILDMIKKLSKTKENETTDENMKSCPSRTSVEQLSSDVSMVSSSSFSNIQ